MESKQFMAHLARDTKINALAIIFNSINNMLKIIGYHSSQEQFSPSELLQLVQKAEQAGFNGIMSSDHYAPWSAKQGQSGFTWSWLGAAMSHSKLPFGVVTCPSGWRYSPAITAQASATLAEMFPGRFWMALGSGQALNEHIVGEQWPDKTTRNERLKEAYDVIRRLHKGEEVSADGHIKIDRAKLYTLPKSPIRIVGAALSERTAKFVGSFADALITINLPDEQLKPVIDGFKSNGGANKTMILQVHVSYAHDEKQALENAMDQWRTNVVPGLVNENIKTVEEFDALFDLIHEEDVKKAVFVSAKVNDYVALLKKYQSMGFDEIYVHNVGRNQAEFIEDFGKHVLPALQ